MVNPEVTVDLTKVLPQNTYIDVERNQPPIIEVTDENSIDKHANLSYTVSNISEQSTESTVSTISNEDPWSHNRYAKNYITGLITVFYALILIIYAIVLELSAWFAATSENNQKSLKRFNKNYKDFNLYIFIVSYIFFAYCYILLLMKPRRWKIFRYIKHRFRKSENVEENGKKEDDDVTVMPNIGSLYLRLGAVVFAIVAVVYFSYSAYLRTFLEFDVCSVIFTILQTHFVFCSSTMFDTKHYIISRFGTMHLVATNLITWFQFLFVKTVSTQKSLGKVYKVNKTVVMVVAPTTTTMDSSSESEENLNNTVINNIATSIISNISGSKITVACDDIECIFGSFTKVFYTAVVEYSLIAAAVMFIVWHNIERVQDRQLTHRIQKKSTIRINCSKSIFGLFAGFGFLAGTFISMALFYNYINLSKYYNAAKVYTITDLIQHCIGIVACILALWRIRLLNYVNHDGHSHDPHHAAHANQELLDIILLAIGLIGELLFSTSGLTGICNTKKWQSYTSTLIAAHVSRIVQAVFQCCLICIATKLKISSKRKHEQPGKQIITFLIFVNISIFIMNLFESDKVGTSEAVVDFYGKENWMFLVRTFSPLTIFYRFHSSVCLAEIWKNVYAIKH